MDNIFNFQIMYNSMNNKRDINLSSINNMIIVRDDVYPLGTRNRYVADVVEDILNGKNKLVYKSRWYDSTQVALAKYCQDKGYKLKVFSLVTDRDNNSFSEIAKTFDTEYIFCDTQDELDVDYETFINNNLDYVPVPIELDHLKSEKILNEMIDELENEIKFENVWLTIVDSDLLARVFKQRGKKVHVLLLGDIDTDAGEKFREDYYISCIPQYPPYPSNTYVDGKLYKYVNGKCLVWNTI